jgi:hypothetical protein
MEDKIASVPDEDLDMDEIADRICLLKDSLEELEQSKVFPLQYKIVRLHQA